MKNILKLRYPNPLLSIHSQLYKYKNSYSVSRYVDSVSIRNLLFNNFQGNLCLTIFHNNYCNFSKCQDYMDII